jgi:hypothetical protein
LVIRGILALGLSRLSRSVVCIKVVATALIGLGCASAGGEPSVPTGAGSTSRGPCRYGAAAENAELVSFAVLGMHGQVYHGHRVRLAGYLLLEHEGTQLYESEKVYRRLGTRLPTVSVWVNVPSNVAHKDTCEYRDVFVEGIYDKDEKGTGFSLGGLRDVTLIESDGPDCSAAKASQAR